MTTPHSALPTWDKFYSHLICKTCGDAIIGQGTMVDPWRHDGDPAPDMSDILERDAEASYFAALVAIRDTLLSPSYDLERTLRDSPAVSSLKIIDNVLKKFCSICSGNGFYNDTTRLRSGASTQRVNCNHVAPVMFDADGQVEEPSRLTT